MTGTQDPEAIKFQLDGRSVVLIDTPGFDDDARSDLEILEDIGKWLAKEGFTSNHQLDGLILLHPITHNRVGGMERKRTRLLEKILGADAYKRIVIATTMWDDLVSEDAMMGRVQGRVAEGGVWNDMCKQGARVMQHFNNTKSAHGIIRHLIKVSDRSGKVKPLLQLEMMNNNGRVFDTSAGRELRVQIEEEITVLMSRIVDLQGERPLETYRKSKNPNHRRAWKQWEEEKQELTKKLENRQTQLKKLGSLVVSWLPHLLQPHCPAWTGTNYPSRSQVRVRNFWSRLFKG